MKSLPTRGTAAAIIFAMVAAVLGFTAALGAAPTAESSFVGIDPPTYSGRIPAKNALFSPRVLNM